MALIVKGIYVSWSNDPPNTKIKDWNVTELKVCGPSQLFVSSPKTNCTPSPDHFYFSSQIDPHRRHVDKSVVAHFWKMLDSWIQTNKPSLVK